MNRPSLWANIVRLFDPPAHPRIDALDLRRYPWMVWRERFVRTVDVFAASLNELTRAAGTAVEELQEFARVYSSE